MTDLEFDVLDELYFVQKYDYLKQELQLNDDNLVEVLNSLYNKEWIKCFINHSEEIVNGQADIKSNYKHYLYLATKKGLLAHNAD